MATITFKAKGKTIKFKATGKKSKARTKRVYITKKPHKGAVRTISAKGLAALRANGRRQAKNLAKFRAAVKAGRVNRSRKGRITKIRTR